MIRVAIVEDTPEISLGLKYIISNTEGMTCQTFSSAEDAVSGITADKFDVVLMDIKLPKMSGIEATKILKEKYPALRIMMCTVLEDYEKIYKAIVAGASGYILKRTEPQQLLQAIKELYDGGAPISSTIAQKVLMAFREMIPKPNMEEKLSERETEVLQLLAEGNRNKEVADKLNVSAATVKSHIYSIYQKLHVNTRVDAINKFRNL